MTLATMKQFEIQIFAVEHVQKMRMEMLKRQEKK